MVLQETERALGDLLVFNRKDEFGEHFTSQIAYGSYGVPIGSETFDFSEHDVEDAELFSLDEELTGLPQVTEIYDEKPLTINVVLHHDPTEKRRVKMYPWLQPMIDQKRQLAYDLHQTLTETAQPFDQTNLYVIGDTSEVSESLGSVEIVKGTENPQEAAAIAAEISLRGLTFIISDYCNLPIQQVENADFSRTVAIKANHELDVRLPHLDKKIEFHVGGIGMVSLNNEKAVNMANAEMSRVNEGIESTLRSLGMIAAHAVTLRTGGNNFDNTDLEIAHAVREIGTV